MRAAYEQAIGQKVEGATFFKVHGAGAEAETAKEEETAEKKTEKKTDEKTEEKAA